MTEVSQLSVDFIYTNPHLRVVQLAYGRFQDLDLQALSEKKVVFLGGR